jgi:orotidine-5'-phosphate decarboxylase
MPQTSRTDATQKEEGVEMGRFDDIPIRERVIVALDEDTIDGTRRLIHGLDGIIDFFKIGIGLFTLSGPEVLKLLTVRKKRIFLDLKFHDIPNSVRLAAKAALSMNVEIFNLHVSGGMEMMRAAADIVKLGGKPSPSRFPIVCGVTILTSLAEDDLKLLLGEDAPNVIEAVLHRATIAREAGLDGVIASGHEIEPIKKLCGEDFVVITPGIRPSWARRDEHKRALGPREAFERGADFIVIGRPITNAPNPREAALRIIEEVER